MPTPTKQTSDVAWTQNGAEVFQIDLSQPAETEARDVDRFINYAFDTQWSGTPSGTLYLVVSQASSQRGVPVLGFVPIFWVPVDSQTLLLGTSSGGSGVNTFATSPSSQGEKGNGHNLAKLIWTPNNGSTGTLYAAFGGVLQ